ncbi:MAG: hypothetical protein AB7E27_00920 [Candidatus Methanomethylophilaceae archaeon]
MPKKDLLLILMLFAAVIGIFSLIAALNYLFMDLNLENAALTGITAVLFLVAAYGMFRWIALGWYAFIAGMAWSIVLNVMNFLDGGFQFYKFNTLAFILLYVFVILWMMDPEVKKRYHIG